MAAHSHPARRVVIAMDGSDYSVRAFEWYVANLHTTNDEYEAVIGYCPEYGHFFHSPLFSFNADAAEIAEHFRKEEEHIQSVCASLNNRLEESGIHGRVVRLADKCPGNAIVRLAEEEEAECIVTGTRGHSKLRQTLLGSVSQYIVHHAHIPVFVCKDKKGK
ncbi:TRAP-T-associated universal stress protein TeaD-like [Haliotis rufescens]|uniref:TRAP-T-associated universal stress protein TeaD-like n=1 Tax=Haliotis rufescens TaxID=6454 RepID=UPI001EAFE1D8|nr:TRAP-T-associated universal stress protein TeaD-like [Haliotis rufescens]